MGTDTKVYLAPTARIRDVAIVLAALHGEKVESQPLPGGSFAARAESVNMQAMDHMPECAYIFGKSFSLLYHFEIGDSGRRGILMSSTPHNIAVARRLVEFFGGMVDFRDDDVSQFDYAISDNPYGTNSASDGAEWERHQTRMLSVEPVTKDEWMKFNDHAAYPDPVPDPEEIAAIDAAAEQTENVDAQIDAIEQRHQDGEGKPE